LQANQQTMVKGLGATGECLGRRCRGGAKADCHWRCGGKLGLDWCPGGFAERPDPRQRRVV